MSQETQIIAKKQRVVVAMSGGVDSSVAAALLKEQGYDVIGVSLKLWDYDEPGRKVSGKTCCSLDDIADAKDVCDRLGIPFYAFNHKPEFKKSVIDVFVSEYKKGRTPNPCVLCNQNLKFDVLLREARQMGADFLATGHYARIRRDDDGVAKLAKGIDHDKDQSYVLFHLSPEDLQRTLFPVGDFSKAEVRELARKYELVTHNKKESMEICFIPDNNHSSFIERNYPDSKPPRGNFVDRSGKILGEHRGIDAYTIGQRRGLGIGFGQRIYVAEIRPSTNEVVLAEGDDVFATGAVATDFVFHRQPEDGKPYGAKARYQRDEIPTEIINYDAESKLLQVHFLEPARAITPGQALVLYDGDEVIGGGWIQNAVTHYGDA